MRYAVLLGCLLASGCTLPSRMPTGLAGSDGPPSGLVKLDATNQDLHRQLAQSQQQLNVAEAEVSLLRKQLASTAGKLQQQLESGNLDAQPTAAPVIRSDINVRPTPPTVVPIADLVTVADEDLVRVVIPVARLLEEDGTTLSLGGLTLLDQVSQALDRDYAGQLVGIEGHTAAGHADPLAAHRESSDWSLAVLQRLSAGGVRPAQLFIVAHGANHPRHQAETTMEDEGNRRIEIVIYPETIGSRGL